jgi:hypothetical protein
MIDVNLNVLVFTLNVNSPHISPDCDGMLGCMIKQDPTTMLPTRNAL